MRRLSLALLLSLCCVALVSADVWGPTGIAAGNDDGFEEAGSWAVNQIFIGNSGGATSNHAGLRWVNVAVPAGATINDATLSLVARGLAGSATDCNGTFVGHDVDDAAQWADGGLEPGNITQTSATEPFEPTAWVTTTRYEYDVTTIIAEIIGRGGWVSGNDIAIALLDNASASGTTCRAYDFIDEENFAELTIDYTEGAGGGGRASDGLLVGVSPGDHE